MVTSFQSYTKSVFFGEYFNQPSPLYLPIKLIEFISEVNPSRNVLDGFSDVGDRFNTLKITNIIIGQQNDHQNLKSVTIIKSPT